MKVLLVFTIFVMALVEACHGMGALIHEQEVLHQEGVLSRRPSSTREAARREQYKRFSNSADDSSVSSAGSDLGSDSFYSARDDSFGSDVSSRGGSIIIDDSLRSSGDDSFGSDVSTRGSSIDDRDSFGSDVSISGSSIADLDTNDFSPQKKRVTWR